LPEGKKFFALFFNSFVKKPVHFTVAWVFRAVLMHGRSLCTYFDALKSNAS